MADTDGIPIRRLNMQTSRRGVGAHAAHQDGQLIHVLLRAAIFPPQYFVLVPGHRPGLGLQGCEGCFRRRHVQSTEPCDLFQAVTRGKRKADRTLAYRNSSPPGGGFEQRRPIRIEHRRMFRKTLKSPAPTLSCYGLGVPEQLLTHPLAFIGGQDIYTDQGVTGVLL
jgi:hypothetical protein